MSLGLDKFNCRLIFNDYNGIIINIYLLSEMIDTIVSSPLFNIAWYNACDCVKLFDLYSYKQNP